MIRALLFTLFVTATPDASHANPPADQDAAQARVELPARFVANRVVLVPTTVDGGQLALMTDTGGGMDQLYPATVARLGLPAEPLGQSPLAEELGPGLAGATRRTPMPRFAAARGIPPVQSVDGKVLVFPERFLERQSLPGMTLHDGFLGSRWFEGRVWTWDYPGERFYREPDAFSPAPGSAAVQLGFRTSADGERTHAMPRITIAVDGREIPVLLDTGATTVLTAAALESLGDAGPAERATSMITDAIFQAWRQSHPEWRVIQGAQAGTGSDMIEVPEVEIAGFTVGPVWFTHRPDAAFHDMMSSMMDQRVEGAIGGNAFRHFVMTVDYPRAMAYFRCATGCGSRPAATAKPPPGP